MVRGGDAKRDGHQHLCDGNRVLSFFAGHEKGVPRILTVVTVGRTASLKAIRFAQARYAERVIGGSQGIVH